MNNKGIMKRRCYAWICCFSILISLFPSSLVASAKETESCVAVAKQYRLGDNVYSQSEMEDQGLYIKKSESITGIFDDVTQGKYHLKLYYRQEISTYGVTNISLKIDGTKIGADYFSLEHVWTFEDRYLEDTQGNQIAPKQELYTEKVYSVLTEEEDHMLEIELSGGAHQIEIAALEEAFYLCGMELIGVSEPITYEHYYSQARENGAKDVKKESSFYREAETEVLKSSKSILVSNDRGSVSVTPYDTVKVRYNVMGGDSWSDAGDWLEWGIQVEETGFYGIMFHAKQSLKLNDNSYRKLTINGEVPFAEAEQIEFVYDRSWSNMVLGNEDGAYRFYFEKGKEYKIRLTACAGGNSHLIERVSGLVNRLNNDYLSILMITGSSPDTYRDYKFEKVIPDTFESLSNICEELKEVEDEWYDYSEGGASIADIQQMYQLLEKIVEDPDTLASRLTLLTSYISSLQTWVLERQEQPLQLDHIYFYSLEEEISSGKENFFKKLWHYICQFIASFTTDYSSIGNVEQSAEKEEITVWLGADASLIAAANGGTGGRDQAQIVSRLVANDFVAETGIPVKVELVSPGTLLTAVVAGVGPDVVLGLNQSTPVNYALRNSIVDLSRLDGIEEVLAEYDESAYESFKLDGSLYALPQSQTWNMLFYRKDILENLGISTESLTTWDSILNDVLPILQINYLEIGMPNDFSAYLSLMYQKGGQLYSDDHMTTLLDSPEGISAFTDYTNMFLESGLPLSYTFVDRFRNGSMPIGITSYTTYNQLSVYAPEIEGLWGMLPIPGTVNEDGSISNVSVTSVEGCGILKTEHLDSAWEFLKWWVSAETQLTYSQELETLLGSAGRNPTANVIARSRLGWSDEFRMALNTQAQNLVGIPEVAGGYYTSRYFNFAFTDVVYNGKNIHEIITQTKKEIDAEIATKTEELYGKEKK